MAPPPLKKTKMGPRSARRLEGVATAWNVVALGLEARGTWRLSSAAVSWRVAVRLPVRRCFEASVGQSTRRWADCQEATGAQTLSRRRSRDNSATIVASENPRVYVPKDDLAPVPCTHKKPDVVNDPQPIVRF